MPPKSIIEKLTEKELITSIAEKTNNSKDNTKSFFDALEAVMKEWLTKPDRAIDVVPGYIQVKVVMKDATKEREGRNPRTGKPITIPAKPERLALTSKKLTAFTKFFERQCPKST